MGQAILLKILIKFLGLLPFPVLYLLSNFLAFTLSRILSYRKEIISKNLSIAFPNKTAEERNQITNDFYKNLSDVIIESLAGFGKSNALIAKRLRFINPEISDAHFDEGEQIIVMGGHINNWEWPNLAIPSQVKHVMASLAKPLSSEALNNTINTLREKAGAKMISTYGSQRAVLKQNQKPWAFVFISDQYPPNQERAVQANLFGRPTLFLHGAQQAAIKKNYPLYATQIKRTKRGHYTMTIELLHPCPETSSETELTQLYADFLERSITEDPPSWLWSHKRWKAQEQYS